MWTSVHSRNVRAVYQYCYGPRSNIYKTQARLSCAVYNSPISVTERFLSCSSGFQPAYPVSQPVRLLLGNTVCPLPQSQLLSPDLVVAGFASQLQQRRFAFASGSSQCILSSPKLVSAFYVAGGICVVMTSTKFLSKTQRRVLHTE